MEKASIIIVLFIVVCLFLFRANLWKKNTGDRIPVTVGDNIAIKDKVFYDWKFAILYFLEFTWRETKVGLCPWAPEIAFGHIVLKKTGFCGQEYYAFIRRPEVKMPEKNKVEGSWYSHNVMERFATPEAIEVALIRFVKNTNILSMTIELPSVDLQKGTIPSGKVHFWKNNDGTLVVTAEGLLSEVEIRDMQGLSRERNRRSSQRGRDGDFLAAYK